MISVLAQERLLGAALGSVFTGIVIFEQRRSIYESISATESLPREPIFGRIPRLEFAHLWNKSVDQTVGPIIKSLSSNGWKKKKAEAASIQPSLTSYSVDSGERGRNRVCFPLLQ